MAVSPGAKTNEVPIRTLTAAAVAANDATASSLAPLTRLVMLMATPPCVSLLKRLLKVQGGGVAAE